MQGWEEKAHKFLYWFTHTELRPVSPYPKVESTKNSTNHLQTQQFLNTTRTTQPMLKKPYFSTPCTPRNPIKEWLTLTPLQTRIKERLHLKRRCKNSKPVVQFAAKLHQHLHQDQRFPRTSTLENPFGKPFKKPFQPFFSHRKCLISVKNVIAQHPFMWERLFFI